MLNRETKFKFTEEWQWDLLRFTVQDKNGEKALRKYEDNYFTLIPHQVIAYCIKQYNKKEGRIPGETMLREYLVKTLTSKKFVNLVTKSEQREILTLVKPLYIDPVIDGDMLYENCKEFSSYVKLKEIIESIDINDYAKYNQFAKQVQNAIADEDRVEDMGSSFLLEDIKNRQLVRQEKPTTFPTPFRQINELTNNNGYEGASIMVILDKQKKGKTMTLVNLARGYLKMRKKILIIDLENGKQSIFFRLEQSIMGLSKKEVASGEFDNQIQRRFRKYKRLGGEIVVERMPALTTTAHDIQKLMDDYYRQYGIQFDIIIVDYLAKMGSISGKSEDRLRISEAYLDMGNLAEKNKIEHVWTANHVTREGAQKRQKTRYQGEDIANCIEIVRHASAIFGLNRGPEEEENGFFRLEIVEQRDGQPNGRAVFNLDMSIQRAEELTVKQRKVYDEDFFSKLGYEEEEDGGQIVSKKRKRDI